MPGMKPPIPTARNPSETRSVTSRRGARSRIGSRATSTAIGGGYLPPPTAPARAVGAQTPGGAPRGPGGPAAAAGGGGGGRRGGPGGGGGGGGGVGRRGRHPSPPWGPSASTRAGKPAPSGGRGSALIAHHTTQHRYRIGIFMTTIRKIS